MARLLHYLANPVFDPDCPHGCSEQPVRRVGQYTYVQDPDSVGDWDDVLNWDTDNDPARRTRHIPTALASRPKSINR